jgi:hypothetical protein
MVHVILVKLVVGVAEVEVVVLEGRGGSNGHDDALSTLYGALKALQCIWL